MGQNSCLVHFVNSALYFNSMHFMFTFKVGLTVSVSVKTVEIHM